MSAGPTGGAADASSPESKPIQQAAMAPTTGSIGFASEVRRRSAFAAYVLETREFKQSLLLSDLDTFAGPQADQPFPETAFQEAVDAALSEISESPSWEGMEARSIWS
jgi:hypothetical protein